MTHEIAKLEWRTGICDLWSDEDWRAVSRFVYNDLATQYRFVDSSDLSVLQVLEDLWGPRG